MSGKKIVLTLGAELHLISRSYIYETDKGQMVYSYDRSYRDGFIVYEAIVKNKNGCPNFWVITRSINDLIYAIVDIGENDDDETSIFKLENAREALER